MKKEEENSRCALLVVRWHEVAGGRLSGREASNANGMESVFDFICVRRRDRI